MAKKLGEVNSEFFLQDTRETYTMKHNNVPYRVKYYKSFTGYETVKIMDYDENVCIDNTVDNKLYSELLEKFWKYFLSVKETPIIIKKGKR